MAGAEGKTSLKIGFLGLGIMGVAMARNLVKAGYHVTVWNRSPGKCKELEQEGASVASSSAECVAANDITIAMLADPAAALAVAKDAANGISAGKGYIDVSTVDPQTAQQIGQLVTEAGGSYLEAPVGGSKQPAEQGNLVFLCGGDRLLFDRAAPLLDVMGKAKLFLGEVGKGSQMKLVINMMMGAIMAVNAEGIVLAQGLGLRVEDLMEVVNQGAMGTPMFKLKVHGLVMSYRSEAGDLYIERQHAAAAVLQAASMAEGQYPTAFPLKHAQKDVRLALAAAKGEGLSLPVASAANGQYMKAIEGGLGDADFSAVKEALKAET